MMAVGVGFEPTHDFSSSGLVDRPLQPLGYPTILVLVVGFEPTRSRQQILSLSCLPFHHTSVLVGLRGIEPVTVQL